MCCCCCCCCLFPPLNNYLSPPSSSSILPALCYCLLVLFFLFQQCLRYRVHTGGPSDCLGGLGLYRKPTAETDREPGELIKYTTSLTECDVIISFSTSFFSFSFTHFLFFLLSTLLPSFHYVTLLLFFRVDRE